MNTAHPIARPTARNRAIAHTRAPNSPVRSRPDHHPIDIHVADIKRTAQTTGCELLDVLTDDQHSGPRRKRPQSAITKHRILASDADATTAWNVSRFRATCGKPPRTPSCSMAAKHASDRFATDSFPGASDRQPPGRMRSSQASSRGKARSDGTQQLTRGRVRESRLAATPPATIRPSPGPRTRPTPRPHNAAPQPNSCVARSLTMLATANCSTS